MDNKKLKIGNLVEILTSRRNTQIPLPTGRIGKIIELRNDKVILQYKNDIFPRSYDEIKPIRITDKLLLKYGFELLQTMKTSDSNHEIYGISIIKDEPKHEEKLTISLPTNHVEIGVFTNINDCEDSYLLNINKDYFHEIQNLYSELTNQELEIKFD